MSAVDPTPGSRVFVALGSNIEPRRHHIDAAIQALSAEPEIRILAVSTIRETAPVGPVVDQPAYLNAVAELRTTLSPLSLLDRLLHIEHTQGRDRSREQRWGPRTLDLDLLVYADVQLHQPGLTVPHPRLAERTFVLEPLCELAPDLRIPGLGCTVSQLLHDHLAQEREP